MTRSPDYNSIPDSAWELLDATPTFRTWIAKLDDKHSVMKTEYLHESALLQMNKDLRDINDGQKWGDNPHVASIPLNVLYSSEHQLMEKLKEGDRDHLKWWLNRPENHIYRTKNGRV